MSIEDALTSSGDITVTVPTGFASYGSGQLHQKATTQYTKFGTKQLVTPPGEQDVSSTYRTRLADQRLVTIEYNDAGSGTFYGPAEYTVTNQAGQVEFQGLIGYTGNSTGVAQTDHINEGSADPIAAISGHSGASVVRMTTRIHDDTGHELKEESTYFAIPTSGAGTDGTHYDAVTFAYDGSGRRIRRKNRTARFAARSRPLRSSDRAVARHERPGPRRRRVVRHEQHGQDLGVHVRRRERRRQRAAHQPHALRRGLDHGPARHELRPRRARPCDLRSRRWRPTRCARSTTVAAWSRWAATARTPGSRPRPTPRARRRTGSRSARRRTTSAGVRGSQSATKSTHLTDRMTTLCSPRAGTTDSDGRSRRTARLYRRRSTTALAARRTSTCWPRTTTRPTPTRSR